MVNDPFNRYYHDQYRNNSAINTHGVHMDTMEVFLATEPTSSQRVQLDSALRDWAGQRLVSLSWSRPTLPVLELKAGYFNPASLGSELTRLGIEASELRGYFAARLDEHVNPAAGKHRF